MKHDSIFVIYFVKAIQPFPICSISSQEVNSYKHDTSRQASILHVSFCMLIVKINCIMTN